MFGLVESRCELIVWFLVFGFGFGGGVWVGCLEGVFMAFVMLIAKVGCSLLFVSLS